MKKIKYILVIYTVFLVSCNRNIHKQLIVNNQDESHLQSKSVIVPGSKIYEHKLPTVEKTGVVSEVIGNTKDSVQSHVENKAIKKDNLKNLSLRNNNGYSIKICI